ncbi:neither inactivation nor afterpotential protein C isoform X2 [Maniola hyperantus]|uniref:neither inactivation nor afterpotential protein C isoform X2 n=1 Tax=Aphantopus hyperantus TaxID=2795564 RepID=UPI00156812FE|nr:neither inactivation nor afterpotential protein C isoform X2 [Maniola hyperantus]
MKDGLNIPSLQSPQGRYSLVKKLGTGVFGELHKATDGQAAGKEVAVKILTLKEETEPHIHEEYKILRDFTQHLNIVDFYGVFCDKSDYSRKIWFVIELCQYGSVIDIVRKLKAADKKMSEEHIAYILKYTIKGVCYLHENNIIHRNIRCNNILITKDGEVKVTDFGLSCKLNGSDDITRTVIGSPSWMAPEMVAGGGEGYGNRVDVWALGISTIEMVDGKAPFENMHPTCALFQIVRNPPPGVAKPSMSSNDINDFINECLEKNPEHRPFMAELEEHPFIQSVPENDFHLSTELKMLANDLIEKEVPFRFPERIIKNGLLINEGGKEPEVMQVEDLAALERLTEDNLIRELELKYQKGHFMSFIGDVLLILNPNTHEDIYNEEYHKKYECKSRSDNAPHVFSVADSAFQDALHHNEPQYIIFSGESKSGKSTYMTHTLSHLTYLGAMKNNTAERVQKATNVIQACISSATPLNSSSTRGILQVQVTYGTSGKLSGALFWLYQLEKWRVSSTDMTHANFNLLYYFYDTLEAKNRLDEFCLERNRKHRYLRILDEPSRTAKGVRETPRDNVKKYEEFIENLRILDWEEEDIKFLETVLAAILILGNVRFRDGKHGSAEIENVEEAKKVSKLLSLEEVKFLWALLNYCLIENGSAVKRKHSTDEARDARDTLASALYKRLVDWLINLINAKLSFMRAVFGDKYSVSLLDMFGFECYHRNRLEQLIVNTTNEQMQFLYNQRVFAWEMQEAAEEEVPVTDLMFYDNKNSVDQLMGKPLGIFHILDEASRAGNGQEFIMTTVKSKCKGPYVKLSGTHEFCVAHYTGKVNYDAREMADKNKDFLPPEMIETMRASTNITLQQLFKNKLTKTGNLTAASNQSSSATSSRSKTEKEQENIKARKFNTVSKGQYSQIRRMRTAAATYRAASLELLKQLSIGPGSGGTNFIRCIRTDLTDSPYGFQTELVRQQIRALAVLDTAKARQRGFSYRVPFAEFIRRYRFLAFDFDENVDETADNCRLLMIRLKMEGWELGKTKVFLKYYNEEFLNRLYETQVKKIIKVQSMMRLFLAKRNAVKNKSKNLHVQELKKQKTVDVSEEEAALRIQKAYRGYVVRKAYGPIVNKSTGEIDEVTARFLKRFARKWKSRSMFQVLLQYRALRYQDLVHFSQQVHIYNQAVVEALLNTSSSVLLDRVDPHAKEKNYLGSGPPTVWKLPFRMDQIQFYDTSHMCDPSVKSTAAQTEPFKASTSTQTLLTIPFCRDPTIPVPTLPPEDSIHSRRESFNKPVIYKRPPCVSPQSYYQPPVPWSSGGSDTKILENTDYRRGSNALGYSVNKSDLPNPVSELQALAKYSRGPRDDDDDDDPPFNFQAMLKKTPKNRASMKRHGEIKDSYDSPSRNPSHNNRMYMNKNDDSYNRPSKNSSNMRGYNNRHEETFEDSFDRNSYGAAVPKRNLISPSQETFVNMSPAHSVSSNRGPPRYEYDRNARNFEDSNNYRKKDFRDDRGYMDNKNHMETIEIAPGLTIEGEVADL